MDHPYGGGAAYALIKRLVTVQKGREKADQKVKIICPLGFCLQKTEKQGRI